MTGRLKWIEVARALGLTLGILGCQPSPTPPSANSQDSVSAQATLDKGIRIRLGGVFVLPKTTIRLVEGTGVTIYAVTDDAGRNFISGGPRDRIPARVRHDAPPDQITGGGEVWLEGPDARGAVHIRALADDMEEPDATYSLWLEEIPGTQLGGYVLRVDPTRLRFQVVDAASAPCGDAYIQARARSVGGAAGGVCRRDLRQGHPEVPGR